MQYFFKKMCKKSTLSKISIVWYFFQVVATYTLIFFKKNTHTENPFFLKIDFLHFYPKNFGVKDKCLKHRWPFAH